MSPPGMTRGGGLIRIFTRHRTASNLLMALFVIGGIVALMRLNTQFFPDIGIDVIRVSVAWPGASAEDVDATIVQAIEPEVRFLDGVKRVRSNSAEGAGVVTIEFEPGTDMQAALADVETAVGQVTTLPEDSERPIIHRVTRFDTISRIVVSGTAPPVALKAWAERIRDDLLALGVDKVDLDGVRDEEIRVEVAPETLRRLDLTLGDIARQIGDASVDLPAGGTRGGMERQVRALGLARTAQEVGAIQILLKDGSRVPLRQIATVEESVADDGVSMTRNGLPAIEVHVQRAVNADALDLADRVNDYVGRLQPSLPPGVSVEQHDIIANLIRDRVNLLVRNGLSGLALVLCLLLVFLNARVAFWVANGIVVAIMGTLVVMLATGQSINMVSLFALIMALGIVVDDAIVVAEHAEHRRRLGFDPVVAAESGARRMAVPVFASTLTTLAAFAPLLLVSDVIGQMIAVIPMVIIAALTASLVECYLILPGHLRGALQQREMQSSRFRRWFDSGFDRFRDGTFRRWVERAVRWRYATIAVAIASVLWAAGIMAGGRVNFVFFESPEADRLFANVEMVAGSPREHTGRMVDELQRAVEATAERLSAGQPLVAMAVGQVGASVARSGADAGDNIGGLFIELVPADQRAVTANAFMRELRKEIRPLPGLSRLTLRAATGGPPGADVDVRLAGGDVRRLKAAAAEVQALLATYPGVSAVEDDLPWGKEEIIYAVTPHGRAMGFTTETVGRQLRDMLEGAIAKRFPRGDEEVEVRVLLPRDRVPASALAGLYLRTPDGGEAPLSSIVTMREETGFARIRREDGARQVSVTAELDKAVASNDDILNALRRDGIADIAARHGLTWRFAGKAEEQANTFADLRLGGALALAGIYIILAWVFASYAKPLVVISIIPLGFVGAVLGHWLLGFNLGVLSLVALVGLSGVVVNDAIILVETIKEKLDGDAHEGELEAIVDGTRDRLRAVILTSVTTIGGLAPLMFETNLQARFLIPMAVTICFGLLVSTLLVLFVVPALMAVTSDIRRLFGRSPRRVVPAAPAPSRPLERERQRG